MEFLVDCHAHLDDEAFDHDQDAVIERCIENKILAVVNPGCDLDSSQKAVNLTKKHELIFACVGTHPHEAKYHTPLWEKQYREWASDLKVVAIGEIGLDYHYDFSPRKIQQEVFEQQLQLAKDLNLPVVIHTREAVQDTYDIMKNFHSSIRAIMHSFSESCEMAEKFLDFGYYISLGGIVTFKNAKKPVVLAEMVPDDRLLIETDSPYLTPVPYRGKRNEPSYTRQVVEKLSQIRGVEIDELANQTTENALQIYNICQFAEELKTCHRN